MSTCTNRLYQKWRKFLRKDRLCSAFTDVESAHDEVNGKGRKEVLTVFYVPGIIVNALL